MATAEKKKLSDLLLVDMQKELEKRNIDNTGTKTVIMERLKKALQSEGKDPNTVRFEVNRSEDDEEALLAEDVSTVTGKTAVGHNPASGDQRIRSEIDGNGGQGQVVEDNEDDEVDLVGNPDNEDSAVGNQSLPKMSSTAKSSAGVSKSTTPAKGKKNDSSSACEGGVDSFVLQEDDTVLNDIDADLLDGAQGEGKASDSTGSLGQAGGNKGGANEKGISATADASAKLVENTDTKGSGKTTGSKDEKDPKTVAKSTVNPVKDEKTAQISRNLWVSGLSSSTRATDLKTLFSKHGKVIAAKVVTNARSPGSRCFGLVTMDSVDDATKSIQQLHRTELHGRMISVEHAKTETQGTKAKILPPSGLRSPAKPRARSSHRSGTKPAAPTKDDANESKPSKEKSGLEEDKKAADLVSFSKIKADQEHDRLRRKQMHLEREKFKQRMIEKRQREEAFKIERERRRLREMREELERQQIETERLRLETERLQMEREKEKYRREQQRVLQERRPLKRRGPRGEEWATKRTMAERFHGGERFEERQAHGDREQNFNRGRGEEHRTFREERPQREGRAARDERHPRPVRHESRSEWKSEREINRASGGGAGAWNGPVERSKMDDGWDTGNMGQGDGWGSEVVLSQSGGGYALQQGQMMTAGMGTGTVFIAQPAMQGAPVMMQGGMARQRDSSFGMAAASVRRF